MKYFRFFLVMVLSCLSLCVSAQSSADKLFQEGQKLQKTETISSQGKAIAKFSAAKRLYAKKENKDMCDNQIAICNATISRIRQGPKPRPINDVGGGKSGGDKPSPKPVASIRLGQSQVVFDGDKDNFVNISVVASSSDWAISLPDGINNEHDFTTLSKSEDGKTLHVKVPANPSTLMRTQTVSLMLKDTKTELHITQNGKSVTLAASQNLVQFKRKGGYKDIVLYTNSDSVITSNNNHHWYVVSKPEWIEVSTEMKKKNNLLDKVKGMVNRTNQVQMAADVKSIDLQLLAVPLLKSDSEYLTGRRGEVVFGSEDKTLKVIVIQEK